MGGVPGLVCPECGKDAKRERRLGRTRRRWRVTIAACLITVTGVGTGAFPKASMNGWLSLVPTTALLVVAPPAGKGYVSNARGMRDLHPIVSELMRRGAQSTLTEWQWAWYIRNKGVVELPDRWPVDTPLQVRMCVPEWVRYGQIQLRTSPDERSECASVGATERESGFGLMGSNGNRRVPMSLESPATVSFDVRVVTQGRGSGWVGPLERVLWNGMVSRDIRVVPSAQEMFDILEGPEWDARARDFIAPSIRITVRSVEQYSSVSGTLVMSRSIESGLEEAAVGFELQLVRAGEVRATATIGMSACDWYDANAEHPTGLASFHPSSLAAEIAEDLSSWTLRVVGRPELAVEDFRQSQAWTGSFELRLDEIAKIERW
jgi:hypothetical protein